MLLVMQCQWGRWAVALPIMDKDLPLFYLFDCCRFPNAMCCHHRITPTEGMNSWKIPGYVFDPGSGLSIVRACLLSNWWNHVHRGSQFTCVIAMYEQDKDIHIMSYHCGMYSHDCMLCYQNVCLFMTWSQVKLRINLSFINVCWCGILSSQYQLMMVYGGG